MRKASGHKPSDVVLEWIELMQPESHILAFVPETSVYVTNMLIIMQPLV